jgi:hypothetical protein
MRTWGLERPRIASLDRNAIPALVGAPAKSKHATASQEETAAMVGIAIVRRTGDLETLGT